MAVLIYFLQTAGTFLFFLGIAWGGIAAGRYCRDRKVQKNADR